MSPSRVLVVGSGVIGLRTAIELLKNNVKVVVRSSKSPLHASTCSQGAGGLWYPFHCDDPRTDRWAKETLDELHPAGLDASNSSVEIVPTVSLLRHHKGPITEDFIATDYQSGTGGGSPLPSWSTDSRLEFQHMNVEMLWWQNSVFKLKIPSEQELLEAGYNHAWLFRPPVVDCPKMLDEMLKEVKSKADVNVETGRDYESMDEILEDAKRLGCDGVVNCTGFGASKICKDDQLISARGMLLHYNRKDCIRRHKFGADWLDTNILVEDEPWGSEELPCYQLTRGETIVVGGCYLEGDTEEHLRSEERERLLKNASLMGIDTNQSKPVGEWIGFRPYRKTSRLEIDKENQSTLPVVHSYGYGGSGWTVYVGAAKEATELLLNA